MKFGLIPPVVPHFPGVTVGGSFSRTAGESSSFRYGYFDKTVLSVEMILGNGEIVTTTPDNKPDLFYGAVSGYGSLAVATLFEIQLIPAKPYVELSYIPVVGAEDAIMTIQECVATEKDPFDFVDGIHFSEHFGVVCVGRMTETCTYVPQGFAHSKDPWFYMHALQKAEAGTKKTPMADTITLENYLFRYDRGAFWIGAYFPLFCFKFLKNRFTRWLFDSHLRTCFLFQSMHISNRSKKCTIQDLVLPSMKAQECVQHMQTKLEVSPMWLCPLCLSSKANMQRICGAELAIDIEVWGPGPKNFPSFVAKNRGLEQKVKELGGQKWLYAHSYYTEDKFWDIYDKGDYDAVRAKYHAETLPTVYQKVKSTEFEQPQQDMKAAFYWLVGQITGNNVKYLLGGTKKNKEKSD
jgi:hypothetical protein